MASHQAKMKKLKKSVKFKWCPNPRCEFVYNVSAFKEDETWRLCPNCDKYYCLLCEKEIEDFNNHYIACSKKLIGQVSYLDRKW